MHCDGTMDMGNCNLIEVTSGRSHAETLLSSTDIYMYVLHVLKVLLGRLAGGWQHENPHEHFLLGLREVRKEVGKCGFVLRK